MLEYKQIFENNQNWLEEKKRTDKEFFNKLSQGQSPGFLFIGCSDSRATAEELMGASPGEVFVHRNVANLVPNNDASSASVIEYAVEHLRVKHVVICGHYFCGGVKAAMQSQDLGLLNPWLINIRDVYRLHKVELDAIPDENDRYNRLVELNVQEQCVNVLKMSVIQKAEVAGRMPEIHGWVFDVGTGKLTDLNIDFESILKSIKEIYNITGA